MTQLVYETNPFLTTLKTHICDRKEQGGHYFYELEATIFFVEGGGQLKDEGTINGIPVLSCTKKEGHIYHETAEAIHGDQAVLVIDPLNRYISRQGHTAQHLLSASFYEQYGISTISHHYDTRGSYIDLDTEQVTPEMLKNAENWVNDIIRSNRKIEVLYPSSSELAQMPVHHAIKTEDQVRIVHIEGVEYNPCKGLHVKQTAEVGVLVIFGTEIIRQKVRIHYFFGEVAREHLHLYYDELKRVSAALSKPMEQAYDGLVKMQEQMKQLQMHYDTLADQLIEMKLQAMLKEANDHYMTGVINMDNALSGRLTKQLMTYEEAYGYLIFNQRFMAFAGKKSGHDAKVLFQKAADYFQIKGGGHAQLCQGGLPKQYAVDEILAMLKNEQFR